MVRLMRGAMLICFVSLLAGGIPRAEVIDRILAVVSGELILQSDVAAAREFGISQGARGAPGAADPVDRDVLSALIDRALILFEVERYAPPEPDAAAVDGELQAVHARFASHDAFELALARAGISEEHLRGTIREELRIRAYLEQRFTVAPSTEAELTEYYRTHQEEFVRGGRPEPFERVRSEIAATLAAARRRSMVGEWVAGLRRRSEVIDLSGR
jgi:hypothetical protein